MEKITKTVDGLLHWCGVEGVALPYVRYATLVLVAMLLAWAAQLVCKYAVVPAIRRVRQRTSAKWDDALFNDHVLLCATQVVPAVVVWMLLPMIFDQFPTVSMFIGRLTAIYIAVMTTRTLAAFTDSFRQLGDDSERSSRQQYMQTFCGVIKILLYFIAAIVIVAIVINQSPTTLLAGLGATSAILMLVFQDTITGLVAGVRLTSNDMLHKGDWITVEKAGVNGIVEEITLTTVKVRNFDNTIFTISPKTLVNDSFQNWIGMRQSAGRKVARKVYYDFRTVGLLDEATRQRLLQQGLATADELSANVNITLYRQYVEHYLAHHPAVVADMTILVRQVEATQNGLPLEIVFFLRDKTGPAYEHALAEIMEHIYAVTPQFGLSIYQQVVG